MRVEREVVLPATPAEVWEAVVDDGLLGEWLGGDVDLDVDLPIEPGASGTVEEQGAPVRRVRIDTVEPERRFRFQWWPDDGSGPLTEVELELAEVDDGTRLRVSETLVAPAPLRLLPGGRAADDEGGDGGDGRDGRDGRQLGFHLRARVLVGT